MTQLELGTRIIVESETTGERYTQATADEWKTMFETWRREIHKHHARLEPIMRRAARRGTWTLYRAAQRASYKRTLPCPMPWDHIMFENTSFPYRRVR